MELVNSVGNGCAVTGLRVNIAIVSSISEVSRFVMVSASMLVALCTTCASLCAKHLENLGDAGHGVFSSRGWPGR